MAFDAHNSRLLHAEKFDQFKTCVCTIKELLIIAITFFCLFYPWIMMQVTLATITGSNW